MTRFDFAACLLAAFIGYVGWKVGASDLGFLLAFAILGVAAVTRPQAPTAPSAGFYQGRRRSRWYVGVGGHLGPFFAGLFRRIGR